jgi:predicted GH43/DUF377 family glycosyl hydrolase
MPLCRLFDSRELLPNVWRDAFGDGPVRLFNPALLREGPGWILAFRAVGPDLVRRIGLCRLGVDLNPVAGSARPWSDAIRFPAGADLPEQARRWFADPRLYRLGGRLYVYWNSGWHEPRNCQFLQEIRADDFTPVGAPRELRLRGERRVLEKNWTLFGDGPFYALYAIRPQRILEFSLEGEGAIEFRGLAAPELSPAAAPNGLDDLRGGAPPVPVGDHYFAIGHYISAGSDGYRYGAAVHRFARQPPFAPERPPLSPLALPNPLGDGRAYERLNPAVGEVVYPCGADYSEGQWTISYGINDERCAVAALSHAQIQATLAPG